MILCYRIFYKKKKLFFFWGGGAHILEYIQIYTNVKIFTHIVSKQGITMSSESSDSWTLLSDGLDGV